MLTLEETFELVARPPENILGTVAPEFDDYPNRDGAIKLANEYWVPLGKFGKMRPVAVAYKAAELLTIGGKDAGATADVTSITEGDLTRTYATKDDGTGAKNYAQLYARLEKMYGSGMRIYSCRPLNLNQGLIQGGASVRYNNKL